MSTSYGDHKFEAKGLPGIHYIWIGPPSPEKDKKTDAGLEIRGHDIEGPMAMAKANKDNPIYFWCLEDHLLDFQEKFEKQKNVQVVCIEDYMRSYLKKNKDDPVKEEQFRKVYDIYNRYYLNKINEKLSISVNDRVTVKDAFSLFLHATGHDLKKIKTKEKVVDILGNGITTLDTSTKPINARHMKILYNQGFRVPYLDNRHIDCWAMQTSNSEKASSVLRNYYNNLMVSKMDTGQAITNALSFCRDKPEHLLGTETIDYDHQYILNEFDIVKNYFNTHKADAKLPGSSNTSDPYTIAIELTKTYIYNHPWQLSGGGKKIPKGDPLPSTDIKVPHIIYNLWEIMRTNSKGGSKETFLELCNLVMKDEKSPSFRLFKGKRNDDTSSYLKLFPFPQSKSVDVQQYIFGISCRLAQDNNRKPYQKLMLS